MSSAHALNPASSPTGPTHKAAGTVRWLQLDVLRGVAILLVLGRHIPFEISPLTRGFRLYKGWIQVGWTGVDLFFVLSGFLIGGLLLGERRKYGGIRFGRFFLRRGFKIWPSYLVFLAVAFVWDVFDVSPADAALSVGGRARQAADAIWPFIVQIQNYKETEIHQIIGTAWSLAVEEHFYLLLPLALFLMDRWAAKRPTQTPYRALPWIGIGLAFVCLGLRFRARHVHPEWDEFIHHLPTHLRIDSLFAGVTLAYAVHFARPWVESLRKWKWAILLAAVACFVPFTRASYTSARTSTIGYSILMVGSVGMVLAAWFGSQPAPGGAAGLTWLPRRSPRFVLRISDAIVALMAFIGARSYSIYLYHALLGVPVMLRMRRAIGMYDSPMHVPFMTMLYLVVACAFGCLAYSLIEAPSVALRDWFFPPRSRGEAGSVASGVPEMALTDGPAVSVAAG